MHSSKLEKSQEGQSLKQRSRNAPEGITASPITNAD